MGIARVWRRALPGGAREPSAAPCGLDVRPGTIYLRFDEPFDGKVGGLFKPDQLAPLPRGTRDGHGPDGSVPMWERVAVPVLLWHSGGWRPVSRAQV
jgi:hypothetical protein